MRTRLWLHPREQLQRICQSANAARVPRPKVTQLLKVKTVSPILYVRRPCTHSLPWLDVAASKSEPQGSGSDGSGDAYMPQDQDDEASSDGGEEGVVDDSGDEEAAKKVRGGKKKGAVRAAVAEKREFLIEKKRPNSDNQ